MKFFGTIFLTSLLMTSQASAVNYSTYSSGCGEALGDICAVDVSLSSEALPVGWMRGISNYWDMQLLLPQPVDYRINGFYPVKERVVTDISGVTYDLSQTINQTAQKLADGLKIEITANLALKKIEVDGDLKLTILEDEQSTNRHIKIHMTYEGVTKKGTPFIVRKEILGELGSVSVVPNAEVLYDIEGNIIGDAISQAPNYEITFLTLSMEGLYFVMNQNTKKDFAEGELNLGTQVAIVTKEIPVGK